MLKTKHKPRKEARGGHFDTIRNESSRKTASALKQARRLEQIAFRIGLMDRAVVGEDHKASKYLTLNVEAIRNVKKQLDWGTMWQRKFFIELPNEAAIIGNPMKVAMLKLNSEKLNQLVEKKRHDTMLEHEACKIELYSNKKKGQWNITKDL